jgi:hypothetical protein
VIEAFWITKGLETQSFTSPRTTKNHGLLTFDACAGSIGCTLLLLDVFNAMSFLRRRSRKISSEFLAMLEKVSGKGFSARRATRFTGMAVTSGECASDFNH